MACKYKLNKVLKAKKICPTKHVVSFWVRIFSILQVPLKKKTEFTINLLNNLANVDFHKLKEEYRNIITSE